MKALARRQPESIQVISLTKDFAKLTDIKKDRDGTVMYVYSMYVDVDIITAIENDVTHVTVEFFPDDIFVNPRKPRLTTDGTSVESFIQSIQLKQSREKDRLLAILRKRLLKTKFEILSQLDLSLSEKFSRLNTREEKLQLLPLKKTALSERITDRTGSSRANIASSSDQTLSDRALIRGNLRLASLKFLMRHGDAGKYAETLGKAGSVESSLSGTKEVMNDKKRKITLSNRQRDLFANDIDVQLITSLQGKDDTHTAVTGYMRETSKRIRHQFMIPAEDMQGITTLRVKCHVHGRRRTNRNRKGSAVLQRLTNTFSHVAALGDFKVPKISPKIMSVARMSPRRNSIEILQNDPNATVVKLYRRVIGAFDDFNDINALRWRFVTEFNLRKGELIKYIDNVDNSKTVTYRVTSANDTGIVCPTYDAAVVQGTMSATKNVETKSAAFYITQMNDHAMITLTNMQIDALEYSFKKRNLTRNQKDFVSVGRFGERTVMNQQGNQDIESIDRSIVDYDLDPDNIYEYICIVHKRSGTTSVSEKRQVYHHRRDISTGLNLVINEVQTNGNAGQSDVTFKMTSSVDPTNLDNIKMLLQNAGLYELFVQQVFDERTKLNDLLCHHVRRYDHMTGEMVSFGPVVDETFSDRKYGRRYGVAPVVIGHQYTYIVSTVLRRPETLFEDYEKTVNDTSRITGTSANSSNLTTQQYKVRPAKMLHPMSLKMGSITSNASRKANYGFDELLYGELGNDTMIQIGGSQTGLNSNSIREFDVQILDEDTNIVTWTTVGDPSSVDYHILSVVDENGNTLDRVSFHQLDTVGTQTYRHDVKKLQNTPIRYNLMSISVLQEIQQTNTVMGPRR